MVRTLERRGAVLWAHEQSRRLLSNMVEAAEAVFAGLWLGILRPEEIDAIDSRHYARSVFASAEYSRRGLFSWERRCIERFPPGGRVLVIATGGGREMLALARMGYEVDGCECNPLLVAVANRVLAPVGYTVCTAERDEFVAPRPPYDFVVVGWGAYALMRGRARRVRFLKSLRTVLRPSASVMLSFPMRSGRARGLRSIRTLANVLRRLSFREPVELGDSLRSSLIHYFSRAEAESEIQQAGYDVEFLDTIEYGHAVCRPSCEVNV